MNRKDKIILIVLAAAVVILLIAFYYGCRGGSDPQQVWIPYEPPSLSQSPFLA